MAPKFDPNIENTHMQLPSVKYPSHIGVNSQRKKLQDGDPADKSTIDHYYAQCVSPASDSGAAQ